MECLKIFDEKFHEIVTPGIKSILLENNDIEDVETFVSNEWLPENPNSLACSYCRVEFDQVCQQREHYKLDWHRYNLRQSLAQKPPITEEEFDEKTTHDDISSISGSDSEKDDNLDSFATAQGKVFLQSSCGTVFSIYSCLIYQKKEELSNETLWKRLQDCVNNRKWAVLMLGGGHFAGAVFDNNEVVAHKTFHCYTVRAGQGGVQSSRDSKSGGSGPKSAGASLRRYNEQALVQHVRGIIDTWKTQLDQCALILYRAAGPYNRGVLFGGNSPIFDKNDTRLRTIPFSTRRATFTEVKRVHLEMTTAQVYHSLETAIQHFTRRKNTKRSKIKSPCIDRAKSREIVERPLPVTHESSSDDEALNLSSENTEISFVESLQEFEDTLTPEQRKKRKPKKTKTKQKQDLIQVLQKGDVAALSRFINDNVDEIIDDEGNTSLHIAAMNEQNATLEFLLLEKGANPCVKNHKQQTPYTCTQSREIRETLKQFARDFPEKYNYNKAQIPTNVLTPEELAEKKRAQRKIKKEKEKIKKRENEVKKREEMEKERFLKLSDREKRALAAERRILSQSGTVITRCFLCACDITGKVPFEYLGNRFCSVECLKAHRLQHPIL